MRNATRLACSIEQRLGWRNWSGVLRLAAAPSVILILFAISVAISLAALVYAQHSSSMIVERDMRVVVALSETAARFDHEDGDLYRLMVAKAAGDRHVDISHRSVAIKLRLAQISTGLLAIRPALTHRDQLRATQVAAQIRRYSDAVDVVSTMLDIDFTASAAMLAPFRANADQVISDVDEMVAAGIANARRHADSSAERTRWLVGVVAGIMLLLGLLSVAWLVLASVRGLKLRDEMRLRRSAEANALVLARLDPLTDLVNRRVFVSELETLLARADPFAVALIDLDDFKTINDLYGHAAGDAVLRDVSARLKALVGPQAVLARLGGDEFAAILPDCCPADALDRLIASISTELSRSFRWGELDLHIGGSVGVSQYPTDATAVDTLLHAADVAMYQAKCAEKGSYRLFEPAMEAERLERRRLEDELRVGIAEDHVIPLYQPIVRLADREVCGFEILSRWQHPRLGLLMPEAFVPFAEQTRQIGALTEAVLRQACRDARRLPPCTTIALNVSPVQLGEVAFADRLLAIIHDAGLSPARFEIELTEDAVMDDGQLVQQAIRALRDSGMSVALDDFGTGFSSLSSLRRLHFDRIKIDRSFVQTMRTSDESGKLVDAIIRLAASFGMAVTAEGIEEGAVADLLAAKGCAHGQGFLFGRPLPIDAAVALLAEANRASIAA